LGSSAEAGDESAPVLPLGRLLAKKEHRFEEPDELDQENWHADNHSQQGSAPSLGDIVDFRLTNAHKLVIYDAAVRLLPFVQRGVAIDLVSEV